MKKVISFLICAILLALLISCRSTHKCYSSTDTKQNPNPTKVTLHQTKVA